MCYIAGDLGLTLQEQKQLHSKFMYSLASAPQAAKDAWDAASQAGRGDPF
jgi:hypothetical protein